MRRELALGTGGFEAYICKLLFYSDDPCIITRVGVDPPGHIIATATDVWVRHMGPRGANVLMGKPVKRELGVGVGWIGGRLHLTGMIAYITNEKQLRTLAGLREIRAHTATLETVVKVTGMLNHLVCIFQMPYHIMYSVYTIQQNDIWNNELFQVYICPS